MKLEARLEDDNTILIKVDNVPWFELRPDETILQCMERTAHEFDREVNQPVKNYDPWAAEYASKCREFAALIKAKP
jgi:hypothetical protein